MQHLGNQNKLCYQNLKDIPRINCNFTGTFVTISAVTDRFAVWSNKMRIIQTIVLNYIRQVLMIIKYSEMHKKMTYYPEAYAKANQKTVLTQLKSQNIKNKCANETLYKTKMKQRYQRWNCFQDFEQDVGNQQTIPNSERKINDFIQQLSLGHPKNNVCCPKNMKEIQAILKKEDKIYMNGCLSIKYEIKDKTQDEIEDIIKNIIKDKTQDEIKDKIKNIIKDKTQDEIKDKIKNIIKDKTQDEIKDKIEDIVKNIIKEQRKKNIKYILQYICGALNSFLKLNIFLVIKDDIQKFITELKRQIQLIFPQIKIDQIIKIFQIYNDSQYVQKTYRMLNLCVQPKDKYKQLKFLSIHKGKNKYEYQAYRYTYNYELKRIAQIYKQMFVIKHKSQKIFYSHYGRNCQKQYTQTSKYKRDIFCQFVRNYKYFVLQINQSPADKLIEQFKRKLDQIRQIQAIMPEQRLEKQFKLSQKQLKYIIFIVTNQTIKKQTMIDEINKINENSLNIQKILITQQIQHQYFIKLKDKFKVQQTQGKCVFKSPIQSAKAHLFLRNKESI